MGTPFFILATGQSNIQGNGALSWSPNARAKLWNNVRENDTSIGTAYTALPSNLMGITARYAHNAAVADVNKDVYAAIYGRGGRDIQHWIGGAFYAVDYAAFGNGKIYINNPNPAAANAVRISRFDVYGAGRRNTGADLVVGETFWLKQGTTLFTYRIDSWTQEIPGNLDLTIYCTCLSASGSINTAQPVQVEFQPRVLTQIENSVPSALAAAGATKVDVLIWWQGESDADGNNRYVSEFNFIMSYLATKPWWSADTKVLICGINSTANNGLPYCDPFNATLASLVAGHPERYFCHTAANLPSSRWADTWHLTGQGFSDAGDLLFNNVYSPPLVSPGGGGDPDPGGGPGGGGTGNITGISAGAMSVVVDVRTNAAHGQLSDGNAYGLWLDGSPHPYRDAGGNKYVVLPHSENYRFLVGSWSNGTTWALQGTTLEGARLTSESAYNNRNWVFGLWSEGNTVYGLVHHEWYVTSSTSDGVPGYNAMNIPWNASTFNRKWVNALSWSVSSNGGRNFATSANSGSTRLVMIPEPWGVQQKLHMYGYFHPSNIVKEGAYYYAAVEQRALSATAGTVTDTGNADGSRVNSGTILIRTTNLAVPTGWQFWNGTSWETVSHSGYQGNLSAQQPYRFFNINNHSYYKSAEYNSHMGQCLRYHTPSGQWLMFGYAGTLGSKLGFSASPTLANPQFGTLTAVAVVDPNTFDGSAGRYISVFDESATDNNYVNIGNNCTILATSGSDPDHPTDFSYSFSRILRGALTISVVSAGATYSITPSAVSTSEGLSVTYSVATTNVANGTVLYWTNEGTTAGADFTDGANSGSVTIMNNAASFTRTLASDGVTESSETLVLQLRTSSTAGSVVATAQTVTVAGDVVQTSAIMKFRLDNNSGWITATAANVRVRNAANTAWILATSTNFKVRNAAGTGWIAPIPIAATATYSITASLTSVNEGLSITYTISCTNVGTATIFWSNAGTTTGPDFTDGAMSGAVSVVNNSATITRTLLNDALTEGGETVVLQLRTGSTNGTVVATAQTVTVNDTSQSAAASYAIAPSATVVNEGATVTYTVTTTNVPNGTTLWWTNSYTVPTNTGWADFTDAELAGPVVINGNTGSFTRTLKNDEIADGTKTMVMQLRTGSSAGPVVATATAVTVNDTSQPPVPVGPPDPYTLTMARNDLDFIYAADVANNGGTFVQLDFAISFDDFYTAGAHHIAIAINAGVPNPHSFHCGPIIRNGKLLWSYGRGFFLTAGADGVYAEHWNGTPSPAFELVPRTGGSGFNPAVNTKVTVRVIGGLRTGPWANQMLIYIRDFNTNSLLFHGSRAWGWDAEATYKAVIAGIGVQFQQPADNGCVERSGPGANPTSSATITGVVHQALGA